jgi:hypothetical protein
MPAHPAATLVFTALEMAPLPAWAAALVPASAALPDRRPRLRAESPASVADLEARLHHEEAEFVVAPLAADAALVAAMAAGDAPFEALARWQAQMRRLLALRDRAPRLHLLTPGMEPAAAMARIGLAPPAPPARSVPTRSAPSASRAADPEGSDVRAADLTAPDLTAPDPIGSDAPAPDPLAALLAALALRHDAVTASLMAELGAPFAPADGAALDPAARAVLDGAADLRQRLLERDTRLREQQLADAAAVTLLRDQMAAQQAGLEEVHAAHAAALQALTAEAEALRAHVAALMSSTSWRITAPLRRLRGG